MHYWKAVRVSVLQGKEHLSLVIVSPNTNKYIEIYPLHWRHNYYERRWNVMHFISKLSSLSLRKSLTNGNTFQAIRWQECCLSSEFSSPFFPSQFHFGCKQVLHKMVYLLVIGHTSSHRVFHTSNFQPNWPN